MVTSSSLSRPGGPVSATLSSPLPLMPFCSSVQVISNSGVSSACLRSASSSAVFPAAAAAACADRADQRAYQTAPSEPAAATIETTSAAMTMAAHSSLPAGHQAGYGGPWKRRGSATSASTPPWWCHAPADPGRPRRELD